MTRKALLTIVAVASLAAAGCGSSDAGDTRAQPSQSAQAARDLPQGDEPVDLEPANFTTNIDNRYWPMVPGTRNGITARVVRDTVTEDGELAEDTFDWYAQDKQGNIWYLGEETAEFENGKLTTRSGSFEAGVDGALPGIAMPGDPKPGMQYRQEFYKGEAEDNGEVLSTREMAETPYAQFDNALLTRDTITIEPSVLEYKLYAPRVGPVLVVGISGGPGSREELVELDNALTGVDQQGRHCTTRRGTNLVMRTGSLECCRRQRR